MTKYITTGGAGFIGSHLVERLVQLKKEVIVLDNFQRRIENIKNFQKIKFVKCDISKKENGQNFLVANAMFFILHL